MTPTKRGPHPLTQRRATFYGDKRVGTAHVVMGAQFGSEGKGEFVAYLARRLYTEGRLGGVVRVGGPNAGHTMTTPGVFHTMDPDTDGEWKMRQIPCGWHIPDAPLFIGPGSVISPEVLIREHNSLPVNDLQDRLFIDEQVPIIDDRHRAEEEGLIAMVGSTAEGIGACRIDHIGRSPHLSLMKHRDDLRTGWKVVDTQAIINRLLDNGLDIIVESTQGFGLSVTASGHWPFSTSRDVTPGQILSDAGISTRVPHLVYGVLRTYPIRVAGNSGPLENEVDWEFIKTQTEGVVDTPQRTTVTGNVRRIAEFDPELVERMIGMCRPDFFCLTHVDYLDSSISNVQFSASADVPHPLRAFLGAWGTSRRNTGADVKLRFLSTGPGIWSDLYNKRVPYAPVSKTTTPLYPNDRKEWNMSLLGL